MKTRHDILALEENIAGKDYIMADLHGNADCLEAQLKQLQPEDRLFIAGDLTDRGADSPRVIRLILDYQAKHPNKLYVVYGNHEDLNVSAISAMADFYEELACIPYSETDNSALLEYAIDLNEKPLGTFRDQMNDIHFCLANGGFWLLELFRNEILHKRLFISEKNSLQQTDDSLIAKYYALVSKLPYIIYVKGRRPFTVVHADMPITHEAMLEKLAVDVTKLSEEEKQHAMNARTHKLDASGRVLNSDQYLVNIKGNSLSNIITYGGHNIINNLNTFVIRPETNTVVLDVMAWSNNVALVACHTDSSCHYVGPAAEKVSKNSEILKLIQQELCLHLKTDAARYQTLSDENSPVSSPSKHNRSPEKAILSNSMFFERGSSDKSPKKKLKLKDADLLNYAETGSQPSNVRK
jgi:hypothetical protein